MAGLTFDGLYVAGWLSGQPHQVLIAAGHGARVAESLVEDRRSAQGYWAELSEFWDWSVAEGTYGDESWHEHVDEWFDATLPEDHEVDDEHVEAVREAVKAERLAFEWTPAEREARLAEARALLEEQFCTEND